MSRQFEPEDYFSKRHGWTENPLNPLLLTFEPSGDGETDIAWIVKGSLRDLGRYAVCTHLNGAIALLNKTLIVNDGIGKGGEAAMHDLNEEMSKTRFSLGKCAVKEFIPVIHSIIDIQKARDQA